MGLLITFVSRWTIDIDQNMRQVNPALMIDANYKKQMRMRSKRRCFRRNHCREV